MEITNADTKSFKIYIMQALLELLRKKSFHEISIKDITDRAGVNRSTYYRNFNSKEDIIIYFYRYILSQCISNEQTDIEKHLYNVFMKFLECKDDFLCLHKNKLSYLLLETLNTSFLCNQKMPSETNFDISYMVYYHAGGVFNTLLLWFEHKMMESPSLLVEKTLKILPHDFKPILLSE